MGQAANHLAISSGASVPQELESMTLPQLLHQSAGRTTGITHCDANRVKETQSYAALLQEAASVLQGFRKQGLQPGAFVILHLSHSRAFLTAFWGCVLGGFVPVPIAVAPDYATDNSKTVLLQSAVEQLGQPLIVTEQALQLAVQHYCDRTSPSPVVSLESLLSHSPATRFHRASPDDLALLMFTSGSTGMPKGVMLSGRNLLVVAFGMATVNQLSSDSISLNWMPLEHVASLVMFHLTQVYLGCQQIQVANELVLQDPLQWLDLIDRYRVTATWAPNFAYGLINDLISTGLITDSTNDRAAIVHPRSWDLSCLRWMGNGAEAVVGKTTRRFLELLAPYGLGSTVVSPGYGMSETCSGIVHSDRFSLATPSDEDTFVELGAPIPGVSLRIVNEANQVLTEGPIGRLQVQGLTLMQGYYQRPELNQTVFTPDGWFDTGDLGFLQAGRLTLTGRQKEAIIINGVNYYSHEIEAVIEELDGVTVSFTAACAVRRSTDTTDRLAIFFVPDSGSLFQNRPESSSSLGPLNPPKLGDFEDKVDRESPSSNSPLNPPKLGDFEDKVDQVSPPFMRDSGGKADLINLIKSIRRQVVQRMGITPSLVLPVAAAAIPKTNLGKIQRSQLVQRFLAGEFDPLVQQVQNLFASDIPVDLPQNQLEQQLAQIWQNVLGLEKVSIRDNFFELGGNSLLLMQVLQRLQAQNLWPSGQSLSAITLFQYPTIATLTQYLNQLSSNSQSASDDISIQQIKLRRSQTVTQANADIAVIGMACRFPGANSIDQFWQNLCNGVESITFFSDAEILASGVDPSLVQHPDYVKASPILDCAIEAFDADFFGYSPREASLLDPQQRLLLECAWEGLEDAGYNPFTYEGAIGLYAGASMNTYLLNHVYPNRGALDANDSLQVLTLSSMGGFQLTVANDKDYLTTRVSYKLNLTGPSVNVQTACSTSLVAIHMARQSLLNGECDMALAGGVSVHTPQKVGHLYQDGMILSADGHCRAFDAAASGTIFGSGAGIVVLKRLDQAIADADRIYAVIKGSAIGNDGGQKVGYFAPQAAGQARVTAEALAVAQIDPTTIGYVEAHGTGTALGDPIEIAGLTQAFQAISQKMTERTVEGELKETSEINSDDRSKGQQYCAIGSVKTNLGHLNIASGVAGFIKATLCLTHKQIPPSLHFVTPNPQIDFANSPFYVNNQLISWQAAEHLRRASVNSLGIGGTNVHMVLEESNSEHQQLPSDPQQRRLHHLLTLSAKNEIALQKLARDYATYLDHHPELPLADVCFTSQLGRCDFEHRLGLVSASLTELQHQLATWSNREQSAGLLQSQIQPTPSHPRIAFLFTGQGSQQVGMGQELYQTCPTFSEALEQCDRILQAELGRSILEVMWQDNGAVDQDSLLHQTGYTQPALFAIEYALAQLWQSWGVVPTAVIGHSVGEYVAACVAGVLTLESALKLVVMRGRLMQQLPTGIMVAAMADQETVHRSIVKQGNQISIAAINGQNSIVISGETAAVQQVIRDLEATGIKTKQLPVSHAFHSAMMEPMLAEFTSVANQVTYRQPQLTVISNLTGDIVTDAIATPDYWCQQLRQPVQFAAGMAKLYEMGYEIFVECGAKPILIGMAQTDPHPPHSWYLASLHPNQPSWQSLCNSLAQLYTRGIAIDWVAFHTDHPCQRVSLPHYPFQRQRYWLDPILPKIESVNQPVRPIIPSAKIHPLLGQRIPSPIKQTLFQSVLSVTTLAYLQDHRIDQAIVFPAAAFIEMLLAAGVTVCKTDRISLADITIPRCLTVSESVEQTLQVILDEIGNPQIGCHIYSLDGTDPTSTAWQLHCSGQIISHSISESTYSQSTQIDLIGLRQSFTQTYSAADHYDHCQKQRLSYGALFQAIQQIWRRDGEALGQIQLPGSNTASMNTMNTDNAELAPYHLHPVLLDAAFQVIAAALPETESPAATYLPIGLDRFHWFDRPISTTLWSHVRLDPRSTARSTSVVADIDVFDPAGNVLAQVERLTLQRIDSSQSGHPLQPTDSQPIEPWHDWCYQVEWHPQPRSHPMPLPPSKSWLIFADRQGIAEQLAAQLRTANQAYYLVVPGASYQHQNGMICLNPTVPQDFERLLAEIDPPSQVIHLWSLDSPQLDAADWSTVGNAHPPGCSDALQATLQMGCQTSLYLIQALIKANLPELPCCWLITAGAQAVGDRAVSAVAQSCLWGLGKVIGLEHPELRTVNIDLDPHCIDQGIDQAAGQLFEEVYAADLTNLETQVGFGGQKRYVARLARQSDQPLSSADHPIDHFLDHLPLRLEISSRGSVENLIWQPMQRRPPEADEVEIAVRATGLNFRDLLNLLQLYPGEAGPLGLECAGEVVAVGTGVDRLAIRDQVIAIAPGSFSQFVTVKAALVIPRPKGLTFAAAATLPTAFLTAHYALNQLAQLQAGERVLIHAAAGGVGQAAIQLAQRIGAEIFATASPSKWEWLRSQGIQHLYSSRDPDFVAAVMAATQGEGIDVVLNSLTGQFIDHSFAVLRSAGRFVEIGKTEVWDPQDVDRVRPDVAYFLIDLIQITQDHPHCIQAMLHDLFNQFEQGQLQPLPQTIFPAEQATEAFRYMQQAKQIGKIILTQEPPHPLIHSTGRYLITGGWGSLGLLVARWLVERGATQLILMGRHTPSPAAKATIAALQQTGVTITLIQADIADPIVVNQILSPYLPFQGIFHIAGVIDDGILQQQTWKRFETVMAAKVEGAWNLHCLTQDHPIDCFVLFSSAASLIGSAGQANYAAANAFLDGLAQFRRSIGLPGLSINWGAWNQVGMAARLEPTRRQAESASNWTSTIAPDQGIAILEALLQATKPKSVGQVGILPIDWSSWTGPVMPFLSQVISQNVYQVASHGLAGIVSQTSFVQRLKPATVTDCRAQLLTYLTAQVAKILGLNAATIDPTQSLSELGLDSLTAVELRNRLQTELDCRLPATLLFDYPTIAALADYLVQTIAPPLVDQATSATEALQSDIQQLSEAEAEALLLAELDRLEDE